MRKISRDEKTLLQIVLAVMFGLLVLTCVLSICKPAKARTLSEAGVGMVMSFDELVFRPWGEFRETTEYIKRGESHNRIPLPFTDWSLPWRPSWKWLDRTIAVIITPIRLPIRFATVATGGAIDLALYAPFPGSLALMSMPPLFPPQPDDFSIIKILPSCKWRKEFGWGDKVMARGCE